MCFCVCYGICVLWYVMCFIMSVVVCVCVIHVMYVCYACCGVCVMSVMSRVLWMCETVVCVINAGLVFGMKRVHVRWFLGFVCVAVRVLLV